MFLFSSRLYLQPFLFGIVTVSRDPVGIRTQDPQLRRLLLYPAELPDHPLQDFVRSKTTLLPYAQTYSMQLATAKVALFPKPYKFIGDKNFHLPHFIKKTELQTEKPSI